MKEFVHFYLTWLKSLVWHSKILYYTIKIIFVGGRNHDKGMNLRT